MFGGADNAAQAQIAGINAGVTQATGNINQGNQALTTNYAAALSPFTTNFGTSQQGVGALGNALGLNGPAGTQSALTALQMTPGYQASIGAGNAGVNAAAAAGGTLNSGNQLLALQKTAQNNAAGNYNNYVSQLDPYLNLANSERVRHRERRHRPRQLAQRQPEHAREPQLRRADRHWQRERERGLGESEPRARVARRRVEARPRTTAIPWDVALDAVASASGAQFNLPDLQSTNA